MDPDPDQFLAWLTGAGIEPAYHPVYRRCIEWIVRCAGRTDFDAHDVDDAIARAQMDPSAARQANNIRTAGEAWLRWRGELEPGIDRGVNVLAEDTDLGARAPREIPERAWIERTRALVAARPEVRAAHLVEMFIGKEQPRHVLWLDMFDGVAAPEKVVVELAARLPTYVIADRYVEVRGADAGEASELCRRVGLAIYERPSGPGPVRTPPIQQREELEGVLSKRYQLHLLVEIDGTIPTVDCLRAVERRIVAWKTERGGKAQAVVLGLIAPRRLHEAVVREVEAALAGRWASLFSDGGRGIALQLAMFDEHGEPATI